MEIVKTYDLEKLKEIVLKEIDVALHAGRDHARINLISAKEIEEILAECMVREERLTKMFESIVKESDGNVCVLDENLSPVFVEKEHSETEMIEGEIEHYIRIIEDKEREINDHHKHLDYMKESIAMKDEQIKCLLERNEKLEKENKELREKHESRKDCFSLMRGCEEVCINCEDSKRCINAVLKKEEQIKKPSCFGKFDDNCMNCISDCFWSKGCKHQKSYECYENEETINV